MKNVAIFLTENGHESFNVENQVQMFSLNGYSFEEIRFIKSIEKTVAVIDECLVSYDLIILFSESDSFEVRNHIMNKGCSVIQETASGNGIYSNSNKLLVLTNTEAIDYITDTVFPYLNRFNGEYFGSFSLRFIEQDVNKFKKYLSIAKQMSGEMLNFEYSSSYYDYAVQCFYNAKTPKILADDVLRLFMNSFGNTIYSLDNKSLEENVINILKMRNMKLAVCESFTGGGIAKRLVSVSGASQVYIEGLNTYSEESKMNRLQVDNFTLRSYGAVSDNTAYEMASGLIKTSGADVVISTTGLAGPKSDRSGLPVGTCYLAVGTRKQIFVYHYQLNGTRKEITEKAINLALFSAYDLLKKL